MLDADFWAGKRVFLTGHTGFKGGWLALWLQAMGADIRGFALAPPTEPALFNEAQVAQGMDSRIGDIRDAAALTDSLTSFEPDIVIHMAAQPLVRLSYEDPVGTYATNVMGTVHLLEAVRRAPSVKVALSVTTDKCYENREWPWGYREDEPMGGRDPYSNSKGCAELVGRAYRDSFLAEGGVAFASARAGNVVGGGDWAADRLIPDILRAFERNDAVRIRNPLSTRPWQHVLEPLSGYLTLCEALWHRGQDVAEGWNFGPHDDDARPVQWIVERMVERWGDGACWDRDADFHPHEARYLKLDISKAAETLHWRPTWRLEETLDRIIAWHHAWRAGADMRAHCLNEIHDYTAAFNRRRASALPPSKIAS
ncbi:CDP-glucose 4,6-dehydratase [Sphingomonas sanguinis]|uniref:CDP-glucose 4,6-dehydratase n=1 Tax=Sphingomonas sanguinis TaxID=33051 RepID=A0ABU5LSV4_9SPHN|nr:CDP-glucose 4,6-dehydratase [Sphingomonas sanguinis]MDZ7283018.1 CDP-glucose 4,6-dehydratase [Sphingomonas sanguinis]